MRRPHLRPAAASLLAILLFAGERTARAEALDEASRDFHQTHLHLEVTPDLEAGTVDGKVTLSFESLVPKLQKLRLHCLDTTILQVTDPEGAPLAHALSGGILSIDLPRTFASHEAYGVSVRYRSQPHGGLYFHRPTRKNPETPWFMYSQGQSNDNRRWIPCYDLPDDRFSWTLDVTVSQRYRTVSNGVLKSSEDLDGGRRVDHWSFESRSPSYLISLIVAELETVEDRWEDVRLEYSAVPGHAEELKTALGQTPAMMAFFSDYTGQPYPWPRYAQTFVWDFVYGGMENTTATTLNMRALHLEAARPNYMSEGLVAHELAHMWFGDLLTCETWDGIWLNEGFATYFTDLFFEHRDGREAFLLRRRDQNGGYRRGTPNAASLDLHRNPRGDRPLELFGGKQYARGAAILHMLRLELGDETFRAGIRAYVAAHRDSQVTSEELRRSMESVAGRDLGWFWDQWVYGAGYPILDVSFDARSGRLTVRQKQERRNGQGLFRFTLPVRRGARGELLPLRIWQENQTFELPPAADGAADFVRVGVGGDLLATIRFDPPAAAWTAALADDPDVTGRLDALAGLEGNAGATPAIARALLEDASYAVRAEAARLLGGRDTDQAAGLALRTAAGDSDPRVREAVFEALGKRTRDLAGATLAKAVREETHDYPRAAAARSLGLVKAGGAYEALAALLSVDSHDDVVRAAALEGLAALGDARGADEAVPYLDYRWGKGSTHRLRMSALETLLKLAPDAARTHQLLIGLLDDPFARMRSRAAESCGTYEVYAARQALRRVADRDENGGVKGAARRALEALDKAEKERE